MPSPSEPGGSPPEGHEPRSSPAPGSPEEALRRLEQRLDQASEAARRLMAQAAEEAIRAGGAGKAAGGAGGPGVAGDPARGAGETAGRAGNAAGDSREPRGDDPLNPPPAGWQTADDADRDPMSELDPFVALVQAMRDLIPPDLQQRLIAALREVLLALRALIDWYLERLDRRREQGVEVQDIPIL